jgi:CheY-like chemotaxis protein
MAVLGSLELAKKRLPEDTQLRKYFDNAVEAAKRGATLTQRMLSFARRHPIEPKATKLGVLVTDLVELLQSTIGPQIIITTRVPPTVPAVLADQNQLETALVNLAVNARDAMPNGGVMTISARQSHLGEGNYESLAAGHYVCLEVTDEGEGMDEITLAKAREPFFTTKGVGKGTGLGLSVVHGMAEQVGGRLILKSAVGVGTTAQIWLKVAEVEEVQPSPEQMSIVNTTKPLRVLAVDDDPLVLFNTVAMLHELGHSVVESRSAAEAFEHCLLEEFDLVLTDHIMPKRTGLELVGDVRNRWPEMPVILSSGYAELPKELGLGIVRLAKPCRQSELAVALRRALERSASVFHSLSG